MTNQEVVKSLKNIRDLYPWGEDSYKTLDYAIRAVIELPKRRKEAKRWRAKALEQEPCEDAVSRQAVIEWLKAKDIIKMSSQEETAREELKALSFVNPQDCDICEVGNPCLYCKHEFEPQESESDV